jgi:exopolysaccharide biosynthesis polyprenyl glycosylphosphotransferase
MGSSSSSQEGAMGVSRSIRVAILCTDFVVLVVATGVAFITRFNAGEVSTFFTGPIQVGASIAPFVWLIVLVLIGSYEASLIGLGLAEYGRVLASTVWMVGLVAAVSLFAKLDTSRAYVLLTITLGLLFLLLNRWVWRRWIFRRRSQGDFLQNSLVIGDEKDCRQISASFDQRPWAGYVMTSSYPGHHSANSETTEKWFDGLLREVTASNVGCIVLSPSCGMSGANIRELSWRIEGSSIDLLISSTLGPVTGPRISLRVATGLPYLHLDEVGLSLTQRVIKRIGDLFGASALLILTSPFALLISLAILFSSGRPIFFRQRRIGLSGREFAMWKFRTMVPEADRERDDLRSHTPSDGPIMKIVDDPRITPVGKFLRRWSLDELPQLVNVLSGSMSLVGPRPHPVDDVERYSGHDTRRLLAKPGLTGLWQVAGRSDLSWSDSIELDLLYIENWSPLQDATILLRTLQAVLSRSGAY